MDIKLRILLIVVLLINLASCGIFISNPVYVKNINNPECNLYGNNFRYSDKSLNYINKRITVDTDIIVLCIHGLGAHAGSFNSLQDYFYDMNISSISFDLRGFGHWTDRRGDIENMGKHLNDIDQIIQCIKYEYNPETIILLGESLGSSLAIWYAYNNPDEVEGLILTSLVTTHKNSEISFNSALKLILGYAFSPGKPIELEYDPHLYSDNKEFLEWAFEIDTLGTRKISARYLIQSNRVIRNSHKQLCYIDQPTLLLQGGKDLLSKKEDIESIISNCKNHQIYFEYFDDNYHSIINDNNRVEIFYRINEWLNKNFLK